MRIRFNYYNQKEEQVSFHWNVPDNATHEEIVAEYEKVMGIHYSSNSSYEKVGD